LLVGVQHSELPAAQRARHAKLLGLMVGFVDRADKYVGITSQVSPYLSPADAAEAFEKAKGKFVRNPRALYVEQSAIDLPRPVGERAHAYIVDGRTIKDPERGIRSLALQWQRDRALCGVILTGYHDQFDLDALVMYGDIQDERVARTLLALSSSSSVEPP
jgi:hypothetical protein